MLLNDSKEKERITLRKEKMEIAELKKENLELRCLIEKYFIKKNIYIYIFLNNILIFYL